jgi:hypothetical protein
MSQAPSFEGDSFSPPPATFPVPPRRVRLRSFPWILGGFLLFLALFNTCLCPVTMVPLALRGAAQWFGSEAPGEITDKSHRGPRRGTRLVQFRFQVNGKPHAAELNVDLHAYNAVKVGDAITVSFLSFWPGASASITEPNIGVARGAYAAAAFVLMTSAVFVLLSTYLIRRAGQGRRLVRHGIVCVGKITRKQRLGHNCRLTYSYSTATAMTATMDVTPQQFDSISIGQVVTVLYDPARPDNSIIYCFGDYRIVGI